MIVYHEASRSSLDSLLKHGIKCDTGGTKTDTLVRKTDAFLDTNIPEKIQHKGVSRKCCLYGYVGEEGYIVDIKSGKYLPISTFVGKKDTVLLRLDVDESRCFVSNLDIFDEIKFRIQKKVRPTISDAHSYWDALIALPRFTVGKIPRPEVMIPYTVPPEKIHVLPPRQ